MIFEIDRSILLFIREKLVNDYLTPFVKFITTLGNGGVLWILLCLGLLIYKPTRRIGIYCAVALALEFIVCNLLIKNIVKRARPWTKIPGLDPLVAKPTDYSFPSGHSSSSIAVGYTLLRKAPRKYGIPIFILGVLICLSRLYVAVHYPSDVIVGALIGVIFSHVADLVINQFKKKKTFK